ncbi:hypothetical protein [Methylobacterium nigriterrae]|uniref:hypothetical protein n=1 Tax=Methylobacterium nigriterrae TaxID=3127512 RepID=UPI003013ADF5
MKSFTFIPFDIGWLTDGDFAVTSTGDGFKAAITLMAKSWSQVPAGSLPDDDRMLANLAGFGRGPAALAEWEKVKDEALSDFELCSDGRFYSRTLAAKTLEAWESKSAQKARTEKAREAARRRQAEQQSGTGSVTEVVTEAVTGSRGEERR